jgi:hypothetical protein
MNCDVSKVLPLKLISISTYKFPLSIPLLERIVLHTRESPLKEAERELVSKPSEGIQSSNLTVDQKSN